MWILIILILAIICILLYLFFSKSNKKEPAAPSGTKTKESPQKIAKASQEISLSLQSAQLAKSVILDETGMLIPEMERGDQSVDLRKRIQEGIQHIFGGKAGEVFEPKKILRLEEVDPEVRTVVQKQISRLKEFKTAYKLYQSLDDPNMSMAQLSKVIVTDPVLSGKILKIANSAYFGMEQRVNSIGHALMIIGLLNLKNILYQEGLIKLLNSKSRDEDFLTESLWEHANLASICASYIHPLFNGLEKGTLFTMGLLHDVGKFVMKELNPLKQAEDFTRISLVEFSLEDENQVYGINHALIGRLAFEEWGFSDLMVKAVELHHTPSWAEKDFTGLSGDSLHYLLVLFISDQVAKLFAGEEKSMSQIVPLAPSYFPMVDKKKLLSLILDSSLFSEIRKAKVLMKNFT
jgi:HD-like signal output (HDOD) protein